MFSILITILLILSIACNIILGYCLFNLLRKFEIYEGWVSLFQTEINNVYARLKATDNRNLFEKDDDVGFVFSELVRIMEEFKKKVQ